MCALKNFKGFVILTKTKFVGNPMKENATHSSETIAMKLTGKKHAFKKVDQFALNTSCFLGKSCNFTRFLHNSAVIFFFVKTKISWNQNFKTASTGSSITPIKYFAFPYRSRNENSMWSDSTNNFICQSSSVPKIRPKFEKKYYQSHQGYQTAFPYYNNSWRVWHLYQ